MHTLRYTGFARMWLCAYYRLMLFLSSYKSRCVDIIDPIFLQRSNVEKFVLEQLDNVSCKPLQNNGNCIAESKSISKSSCDSREDYSTPTLNER